MKKFNVLIWDFNNDMLEPYDVLPYFRRVFNEKVEYAKTHDTNDPMIDSYHWKVPQTIDEFKEFVKNESMYQFWSRCEYEMICHGWPVQNKEHKLDVHEQIMMNIDIIAEILYNEFETFIERNKKQFYFDRKEVSWEELPIDIRKKDYYYYFDDNGNDCYPISQDDK